LDTTVSSSSSVAAANNNHNKNNNNNERIDVLYGIDTVIKAELHFFSNSKEKIDTCMNYTGRHLAIEIPKIRKAFIDAKARGIKVRYLTEITSENISFCKELMSIIGVEELRHLDGIKGSFTLSESEYLATLILSTKIDMASQIAYSNVKDVIEHQQYIFDTLWEKAISAAEKIKEIEEVIMPIRTRLLEGQGEIIGEIMRLNNRANKLSICTAIGGMQMSYNYLFDSYRNVVDKHRKGQTKEGLRWLTNIDDKESANLVEILLQSGMLVRHTKSMLPLNFGVSDIEVALTVEKMEGGKVSQSFLISNDPLYVNHFNSLFEELWKNGIDAIYRIREIEEKEEVEFVEVISDHERASSILLDLAKSLKKEALSLMPTARGMLRMYKLGVIDHLIKASQNGAVVKIICPLTDENSYVVGKISEQAPDIRIMNSYVNAPSGILIADGSRFLQAEVKNPPAEQFSQAIGFTIYSNSKYNVNSFKSFFELLWNEHALNEELRRIDKMQKEFMNVAAHELKTPIQPILGVAEVLSCEIKDTEQLELLDIINRNAKRLKRLTEDILDVTKIESQTLQLRKELFCINELISSTVNDYLHQFGKDSDNKEGNVKLLLYNGYTKKNDLLFADKGRIAQVFDNILNNAIKFTDEGSISVTISAEGRKKKENVNDKQEVIVISVKDTGKGIDPEIMPRLFTKFSTKSFQGTGLGLYISKSIIEAHGGKIWAQNNADGKGATFYFSLPLRK
jgi:signal transduction histidine kinase